MELRSGNYEEAIAHFEQTIAIDPQNAEAYYYRGVANTALGNYEEVIVDLDQAIAIDPQNAKAYYYHGVATTHLGSNDEEAIAYFDQAIAIHPEYAVAYSYRGRAKQRLGYDDADVDLYFARALTWWSLRNTPSYGRNVIINFSRAIAIDPQNAKAYYYRGMANATLGNDEEAIVDLDQSIAIDPENALAYLYRGIAKADLGNDDEAIIDLDQSIAIDSENILAYLHRGRIRARLNNYEYEEATADINQAIEYSHILLDYGHRDFRRDNFAEAIIDYSLFIDTNNNTDSYRIATAYLYRGLSKTNLGNDEDVTADYIQAVSIDPEKYSILSDFGEQELQQSKYEKAIVYFSQAIAIFDQTIAIIDNNLQNDPSPSYHNLRRHLRYQYVNSYVNRGRAKAGLGNSEEAIDDYNQAIVIDPRNSNAYFHRGIAKADLGNDEGAVDDYTQAIVFNSRSSNLYLYRGGIAKQVTDMNYNTSKRIYFHRRQANFRLGRYGDAFIDSLFTF